MTKQHKKDLKNHLGYMSDQRHKSIKKPPPISLR